ncbi:forkhead domain-containing protein [Histoplasma capsulatum H143]|uniref:Forkhead domain-containing protein n=1 Tax=Ajellomyces capsulatus (strain H143) TaxID=544712 RepID=C6H9T8_AJECH|nr:forkhead domain-containing protein [Histoplasma capsulatum H143]
MKDDSAYHHLQPRNPRSRYLPPETEPVYGTPPLEQPLSFADIAPPGHIVNSSSCSTSVSSFNDLSNLDPNCLRHPKAVQHPSTLIQHSCQFAMDQNFIPSSDCTNYTSPFDTGSPEPMAASAGQILSDGESDDEKSDEPYSKLIWRALQSVPDNKMTLKEIYEWFEKNTNKARNSDSKGWQNSIRHNLSMNAAFEGVKDTSSPDGTPRKTANVWVLTKEALQNGVQSTTRYRKVGSHKKHSKLEHPAPQRQRSGAKGGKAAKKTSKMRRVKQDPHVVETANRSAAFYNYQPRDDNTMIPNFHYRPQLFSGHSGGFTLDDFGLENVIGTHPVSDLHDSSVLSDPLFSESNGFSTLF